MITFRMSRQTRPREFLLRRYVGERERVVIDWRAVGIPASAEWRTDPGMAPWLTITPDPVSGTTTSAMLTLTSTGMPYWDAQLPSVACTVTVLDSEGTQLGIAYVRIDVMQALTTPVAVVPSVDTLIWDAPTTLDRDTGTGIDVLVYPAGEHAKSGLIVVSGGSYTSGVDYLITGQTLSWGIGDLSSRSIRIDILDTWTGDDGGTIVFTLTSEDAAVIEPSSMMVTVYETYYILAESGAFMLAESSDNLVTEAA